MISLMNSHSEMCHNHGYATGLKEYQLIMMSAVMD